MYELHHAPIDLGFNDIPCLKFNSKEFLSNAIEDALDKDDGQKVYLLTIENYFGEDSSVFIDDKQENIFHFFCANMNTPTAKKVFLQEYTSYEEAYNVALTMKEGNQLCYEKENIKPLIAPFSEDL